MPKSNETATPEADEIAKRAYELYLQRGSVAGYELDDWLQAGAELSSAAATADESERPAPVQPVVRRRAARGEAHPPSNRRSVIQFYPCRYRASARSAGEG